MFKKLKMMVLTAAAALTVATPLAVAGVASANSPDISGNLCGGANLSTGTSTDCNEDTSSLSSILATIVNILSLVIGVVAVIMVIWGGFNYITSGGDSGKVGTAKSTIMYAIIGLVIVAFAQLIVKFVLNKAKPGP